MASKCDRCGKSVAGYTYCGGCVGDNTPMPKQAPPMCPWCDEYITDVSRVFDYRPDVHVGVSWDEVAGNYVEFSEIGENTDWHWEANCGHEVSDPMDSVGDEYVYGDNEYDPEDGYAEGFVAWATEVGITP